MTHHLHKGQSVVAPVEVWDAGMHDGDGAWKPATAADNITLTSSNPELTHAQVVQDGDVKVVKLTNTGNADTKGASVTVMNGDDHHHVMNFDLGTPAHGAVRVNMAEAKPAPDAPMDGEAKPFPAPQLKDTAAAPGEVHDTPHAQSKPAQKGGGPSRAPSGDPNAHPQFNDAKAGGVKP
jgi:hypothetical protein